MKWPQIIAVLLGVVAVAIAVRFRGEKPDAARSATPVRPSAPIIPPGHALAPSFDRPGMASRLIGLMRTYVAVAEEVRFGPSADDSAVSVPILIVFENETYRPLRAADMGWLGNSLCSVRVVRVPDGGGDVEVFQKDVPLPTRADWLSAERRTMTVDWPLREGASELVAGRYKISVRLALPDEPVVELYTRLL